MYVLLRVAAVTGSDNITPILLLMTVVALDRSVLAEQRKFAVLVVVEQDGELPTAFVMTLLTFFPKPPFVHIFLLVTGHTRSS